MAHHHPLHRQARTTYKKKKTIQSRDHLIDRPAGDKEVGEKLEAKG